MSSKPHSWSVKGPAQLELGIGLQREPDRNHKKGGRSFYFFDLDDNVLHLPTLTYIYDSKTGDELALSTGEFARISGSIGKPGPYESFFVNPDDRVGSFRNFRDNAAIQEGRSQPFVEDIGRALEQPDFHWKGPSWECFYYAVFNQRPISLITARGHSPSTIREGISLLVKAGYLPCQPNYLDIFPVSFPQVRIVLGGQEGKWSTAELKKNAIIRCVENAMVQYDCNPHHRFGMSDDDPLNIQLIIKAKQILKARYPENSFYVIRTDRKPFTKEEIFCDGTASTQLADLNQLALFEE